MIEPNAPFAPDWASPLGDTIVDLIEERGWTQAELAERLGYSAKHVNRLVQEKVALTEDAALRLEPVLGASAGFWLTREARYRERATRLKAARRYAEWVRWLDELPVRELMNAGAVPRRRIDTKSRPGLVEVELIRFRGYRTLLGGGIHESGSKRRISCSCPQTAASLGWRAGSASRDYRCMRSVEVIPKPFAAIIRIPGTIVVAAGFALLMIGRLSMARAQGTAPWPPRTAVLTSIRPPVS